MTLSEKNKTTTSLYQRLAASLGIEPTIIKYSRQTTGGGKLFYLNSTQDLLPSPTSIFKTTHCSDCKNVECCCLKFSNLSVPYGLWMWNCLAVHAIVPHQNRSVAVGRANSGARNVMGTPQSATPALHFKSPAIMNRPNRNGWTAPRDRRRWPSG